MGINEKQRHWSAARKIYKEHYGQGSIKPGHVLHHLDHNPANNDIINLAQMSRLDHSRLHNSSSNYSRIKPVKNKIRRTTDNDMSKIIWFDI